MISEFALDPKLVAQWHDPKKWAFYREAFAAETGRLGSMYPPKWRKEVIRAFHQLEPGATNQSRSRMDLEVRLDALEKRMVKRESSHPECSTWLEKAIAEHQQRPFSGILSVNPHEAVPEVITPDMLFSERPPSTWSVPQNPSPPRTSEAFAQALAPLLTRCKEAVFVDPHFNPSKERYMNPLEEMLKVLWGPGRCVSEPKAQLIMAEGEGQRKRDPQWLLKECQQKLPRILSLGRSLKVTVLRQRKGGEKIHNRYVLTLLAGVSFGTGLDVANDGETGQSDDLFRLSSEQLNKRWAQYVSAHGPDFEIAARPQEISNLVEEGNTRRTLYRLR